MFSGALLRAALDSHLQPLIKLEVNKDYTQCNGQQLREQLQAHQARKE